MVYSIRCFIPCLTRTFPNRFGIEFRDGPLCLPAWAAPAVYIAMTRFYVGNMSYPHSNLTNRKNPHSVTDSKKNQLLQLCDLRPRIIATKCMFSRSDAPVGHHSSSQRGKCAFWPLHIGERNAWDALDLTFRDWSVFYKRILQWCSTASSFSSLTLGVNMLCTYRKQYKHDFVTSGIGFWMTRAVHACWSQNRVTTERWPSKLQDLR